jgi:hypothetical protein
MTTQLLELNEAQTSIYNRSNLRRAIKDFDDTEIASITLRNNLVVVVRTDGSQQTYPREIVVTAYQGFTGNALSISFLTLDLTIVDHLSGITMDTSSSKDGHTVMPSDTSLLMQNYRRHGLISLSISMIKQNLRHCYNQNIQTLGILLPLKASDICNRLNSVLLLTILRVMTLSRILKIISLKNMRRIAHADRLRDS